MLLSSRKDKTMASQLQLEANRRNAQKSTGPRTPEGKATCSRNALKTGLDAKSELIEGRENREEREQLTAACYARFNPATEEERYLVDTLIASEWLQRRYLTVEAGIWNKQLEWMTQPSLGGAFIKESNSFCRVDRRLNSAHRNYSSALKQLQRIQAGRPAPEPSAHEADAPAGEPADVEKEPLHNELGLFLISTGEDGGCDPESAETASHPPIAA